MMKRGLIILFFLWFLVLGLWSICPAQPISSVELINNAKQYDGQEVVYRGEAIGEVMRRSPYAWVNINDGKNALGIWAEAVLLKDISLAGSYKVKGDIVEVSGVFHRACLEHGGDLDIHASRVSAIERGKDIVHNVDATQKQTALLLLGALIFVWILNLLRRK